MLLCFQETNALKKDGERQTEELEELRTANKSLQDQMSRLKQAVSPYILYITLRTFLCDRNCSKCINGTLQNVRFQNIRVQNVRAQNVLFHNVWFQNVRFAKRQVYKTSGFKTTNKFFILFWWGFRSLLFSNCDSNVCSFTYGVRVRCL